jgi:hypothetical protein
MYKTNRVINVMKLYKIFKIKINILFSLNIHEYIYIKNNLMAWSLSSSGFYLS